MLNEFKKHFRSRMPVTDGNRNSGDGKQQDGNHRPSDGRNRTLLPAHLLVVR